MRVKELTWDSVKVDLLRAEQYDPKYLKLKSERHRSDARS
jgi:hypothetical protein